MQEGSSRYLRSNILLLYGGISHEAEAYGRQHSAEAARSRRDTVSGIILATANKEKPAIYEVVAVGPGTKDVTMTIAVGDRVVVSKHVGTDISLDKVDYKFVKQDDVLAVVTD